MKILYTAFDVIPSPKGASTRIAQMLGFLAERYAVRGVFLGEPGYCQQEDYAGVPLERLIAEAVPFLERAVFFANQVMERALAWQPDVIHCRSLWDAYPLACLRRRYGLPWKLLFEVNGLPRFELAHHFQDMPEALWHKIRAQECAVLQQADGFLCPSGVTREYLVSQGVPRQRIAHIPNGVDTELFRPGDTVIGELPQLLYIGTLAPWQGLEDLLAAIQQLPVPVHLRILGKGNPAWHNSLATRIFQLGLTQAVTVEHPLPHAMVPAVISQADICIAPLDNSERNRIQGCHPLKILEYLACGKAVVAPDLPAIAEILTHDQDSLLYPVGDGAALRACLEKLIADRGLRERLGQQARRQAVTHCQWEQAGQKLLDWYALNAECGMANAE